MDKHNSLKSSVTRQRLSALLQNAGSLIAVTDAAQTLDISAKKAAMMLSKWTKQGWFKKIRRGLYAPIPIEASSDIQLLDNIWILVPKVFGDAYVGGWSAAEHWGLTEQVFQSTCVITAQKVRNKEVNLQNNLFYLKHVQPFLLFGLKSVWYKTIKIQISDPHKTIIDMLDDPALGGGIHHVDHCLQAYLRSDLYDEQKLIAYAEKQKNGAIFKRLGYLASISNYEKPNLIQFCKAHITKGKSYLEPGYKEVRLITAWGLMIPKNWQEEGPRD